MPVAWACVSTAASATAQAVADDSGVLVIVPPIEFEVEAPTLADYDWVQSPRGDVIHAPHRTKVSLEKIEGLEMDAFTTWLDLACGRTLVEARIPGMFTRMGAKRCDRCCDALGYPRGIGSPKNDAAIRALRGWDRER